MKRQELEQEVIYLVQKVDALNIDIDRIWEAILDIQNRM